MLRFAASLLAATLLVHAQYDTASILVGGVGPVSQSARSDFVGFSLEYKDHLNVIGNYSTGVKLSYMQLLQNIQQLNGPGSAGPRLRIGGNSATVCWLNPNDLPAPSPAEGCFLTLTDFKSLYEFLRYTHGPLSAPNSSVTFGLNFYDGHNASFAVQEALAVQMLAKQFQPNGTLTSGFNYGMEIGNEVDEYGYTGARWSGDWTSDVYWQQWSAYVANISAALKLSGADTRVFQGAVYTMQNETWDDGLVSAIASGAYSGYFRSISYHIYGSALNCQKVNISAADFLSDNTTTKMLSRRKIPDIVAAARAAGLDFWVGEANSIACGGQWGLSDTFASALWAVDFLLGAAALNMTGVHFHGGSGGAYSPVTYANQADPSGHVRPVYVGMLAAAEFLSNSSAIMPAAVAATTIPPPGNDTSGASGLGLKVYAAADVSGTTRVFAIHRGLLAASPVALVSVAAAAAGGGDKWPAVAYLARLQAPEGGVNATHGTVWAGQSFDGSQDGKPLGPRTEEPVPLSRDAQGNSMYVFELFVGSAAMLRIPK